MDDNERLHLQRMIKEHNIEETTDKIRRLKHSSIIRENIDNFLALKKKYSRLFKTNNEQFKRIARNKCEFLVKNYMNLYNRLLKDELDLKIVATFLTILQRIENGEIDQHEGSYEVGKLLKELYIDSTLRRDTKREKKLKKKSKKRYKNITWGEFKRLKL